MTVLPDLFKREMASLKRAYEAGNLLACEAAFELSQDENIELPNWAVTAVREAFHGGLTGNSPNPRTKGRSSGPLARVRQDLVHFIRWDIVICIRNHQSDFKEREAQIREAGVDPDRAKRVMAGVADFGNSLDDAFDAASRELQVMLSSAPKDSARRSLLREAVGAPLTIRKSYLLVKRLLKDPREAGRALTR